MVGDGGEGGLKRGERSEVMMAKKRNDGFLPERWEVGHDLESCHLNFIVRHRGPSQLPILNSNAGVYSKLKNTRCTRLASSLSITLSHSLCFDEFA
jgi:hypothetical protein